MDHKNPSDIWPQVIALAYKYLAVLGWVFLALIGQFSYDLIRNKKMSRAYIVGSAGVSLFVGIVIGGWIFTNYPDRAPIAVPIITLLSRDVMSALMVINWKALLKKDWKGAFEILTRKKD